MWIRRASSCRCWPAVWPLLPRWLERSYQPPAQAQGREKKPIGTPNWLAAAGSKHTGPGPAEPRGGKFSAGGNRIKRRLSNSAPGLCPTRLQAGRRRGLTDGTVREGTVPRGSESWDPEGGGEQLYPAKHVYFPCLHVGKIQAPYGSSEGWEGDSGSRLPFRVSLEKEGNPSLQNPTFPGTLLGDPGRVTIAEKPQERG